MKFKFKIIAPFKKSILVLFILNFFSSVFFLAGPYFSKLFIDKSLLNRDLGAFLRLAVAGSAVFLFSILFKVLANIVRNRVFIKVKLRLSDKFIRKIFSLDLGFLQSKSVGENIYRLSDSDRVSRFMLERVPALLVDSLKLPIIIAISILINARLSLILLIFSPLFVIQSLYIRRKLKPLYEEIWMANAKLARKIYESFSRILIVKVFAAEARERRAYFHLLLKNTRLGLKSFRWSVIGAVSAAFLSKAVLGGVSLYGGWMIIKGELSLGSYTAIMLYLTQLGGLLQGLSANFEYFIQDAISLKKFFEIMEVAPRIKSLPDALELEELKGEIQFNDVCFGYRQDKPIFKNINLSVPFGKWLGIAGASGCGKTTLINLILRLYDPQKGGINLGGRDLKEINLRSLRDKIGFATQEPLLFDFSIGENIAYGLKDAPQERIQAAVEISQLRDFITQLPKGYDTLVGENASILSQGYKQRVALARAIARDSDLLILDEATSSIDSATEEKILNALRSKRSGRSTIVISHRLSTIRGAERIYFFRPDGRIEEGTHDELLGFSQVYRNFFQNQAGDKNRQGPILATRL